MCQKKIGDSVDAEKRTSCNHWSNWSKFIQNSFSNVKFIVLHVLLVKFGIYRGNQPKMVIYGVYIVSKSGGLIFNHDHNIPKVETEKVFTFPIDLTLEYDPKKVHVLFGQKDGIMGKKNLL